MRVLAVLGLWLLSWGVACADTCVYVSVAGDKKIAVYKKDADSGKLTHLADTATDGEPGALTVDPRRQFLFASLRSAGKLASFRIDPRTGKLTHLGTVPAGADPAHISTDRAGRFLLCAYYVAGQVTVHAIAKDGRLGAKPQQTVKTAEKAHAAVLDPTNDFAFAPHTGPNAIFQFKFQAAAGTLTPAAAPVLKTPPNTGPRHLVFHPTLDVAYVSNEQGGSATAYELDRKAGTLRPLQTLSTLPAGFKGENACAEVRIHPRGKFLYVSSRGHNSIACFRVWADGGLTGPALAATEPVPRSFDLDPDGHFLYAAGESSGKLAAYTIDSTTGELRRFTTYDVGRQPWWVKAVRLP
jgi:6-phosphogluconolactonase